jgi:branched-chain amino acid transport system permease protein
VGGDLAGYLLDGLSIGCLYAFIALGYTMVYGIIKLINFAHGEVFMVGAFIALESLRKLGVERLPLPHPLPMLLAWLVAGFLAAVGCAALAVAIEKLAYRPLRGRGGPITALLAALGVSLCLQNVFAQPSVEGASQQSLPEPRRYARFADADTSFSAKSEAYIVGVRKIDGGTGDEGAVALRTLSPTMNADEIAEKARAFGAVGFYEDEPISVRARKLIIFAVLAASTAGLYVLVKHTRQGKAMRAVSWDVSTARLMGVNVDRTISFTFFVGAFLAGIGGQLWAFRYGKVEPYMGMVPGLKAFIAAVLGGIGSIPGAVVGGLALGVLEALATALLPEGYTSYRDAVAFVVLIVILLVRPSGLFGRWEGEKV